MDARPGWLDHTPSRRHSQFSPYYTLDSVDEDAEAESLVVTAYEASTFSTAETLRHTEDLDEGPIPIISPKPQSLLQMEPRTYQCECTERECIHYLTPHVRGPIWMPNEHQQKPYETGASTVRTCNGGASIDDSIVMNPAILQRIERGSPPTGPPLKELSHDVSKSRLPLQYTSCPRLTRKVDSGCESIPCVHGVKGETWIFHLVPANPEVNRRRNIFRCRKRGGCVYRAIDNGAKLADLTKMEEAERKRNEAGFTDRRMTGSF